MMNVIDIAGSLAAAEHGGEPHVANWWGIGTQYAEAPALGWVAVTFVVFVVAIVMYLGPRFRNVLADRADLVEKGIEEARRAREAAEARAQEAESKLKNLEDEMRRLRADFEEQGKAELERLEKMAQDTAVRIGKDAEDTIAAETDRARQSLRAEAARLALEMAEERIRAALSGSDDARLQKALIDDLGRPSA